MLCELHKDSNYKKWNLFLMRSQTDVDRSIQAFDEIHPHADRQSSPGTYHDRYIGNRIAVTFFTDGQQKNEIYIAGVVVARWLRRVKPNRAVRLVFKDMRRLLAQEAKLDARWGARRLALAMARHARLGAQSALGSLDAELIARIAEM